MRHLQKIHVLNENNALRKRVRYEVTEVTDFAYEHVGAGACARRVKHGKCVTSVITEKKWRKYWEFRLKMRHQMRHPMRHLKEAADA